VSLNQNHQQELVELALVLVTDLCSAGGSLDSALLALSDRFQHVPPTVVSRIAELFVVERPMVYQRIEAMGLVLVPPGRHKIYICRAANCCQKGSGELLEFVLQYFGMALFETAADYGVRLEPFYCLGQCASGPNIMIDGQLHSRVTLKQLEKLLMTLN